MVFLLNSLFHTSPHLLSLVSGVRGQRGAQCHICFLTRILQKTHRCTPNWPKFQLIVSRMKRKPWLTLKAIDPLSFTLLCIVPPTHNVSVRYYGRVEDRQLFLKYNYSFGAWDVFGRLFSFVSLFFTQYSDFELYPDTLLWLTNLLFL